MNSKLIEIASYANEIEANHVRSILEQNGITAFVDGGATNTMLSHVGSALGGVRILTSEKNIEAAYKIIDELEGEAGDSWFCGECREFVEAGFDICWACGKDRADVESTKPQMADTVDQLDDVSHEKPTQRKSEGEPNPYLPPGVADTAAEKSPRPDVKPVMDADEIITRALRASIIGLVTLPGILHLYSTYLLMRVAAQPDEITAESNGSWYYAFAINMMAIFVLVVVGVIWL